MSNPIKSALTGSPEIEALEDVKKGTHYLYVIYEKGPGNVVKEYKVVTKYTGVFQIFQKFVQHFYLLFQGYSRVITWNRFLHGDMIQGKSTNMLIPQLIRKFRHEE